jgi:hypothetical protein
MRKKSSILCGLLAAAILLGVSGCARETRLTSIAVNPPTVTFQTAVPGGEVHFSAIGTYIHPPGTKDITADVTWKTDIPQLLTVSATGVVTPTGAGCGIANVIASSNKDTGSSDNVIIGSASVTVNDPNDALCPGGSTTKAVLTVILAGGGTGTVTSSPAGITCPTGACAAQFDINVPITLTPAAATGSTFGGWINCPSTSGNSCIITLSAAESVTATFN